MNKKTGQVFHYHITDGKADGIFAHTTWTYADNLHDRHLETIEHSPQSPTSPTARV